MVKDAGKLRFAMLALFSAPAVAYAGAVVTLTSPTDEPTRVVAGSFYSGSQRFQSADTSPFDHTARSSGGMPGFGASGGSAHLMLTVAAPEIRSSFDASCGASIQVGAFASANYAADFSLDIAVDVPTPFSFQAEMSATGSSYAAQPGFYSSDITYRLYTPDSAELDVSFGVSAGLTKTGQVAGVLLPGSTYRLKFQSRGSAETQYEFDVASSNAAGTASVVLVIPEPTATALLWTGAAGYLAHGRRRPTVAILDVVRRLRHVIESTQNLQQRKRR